MTDAGQAGFMVNTQSVLELLMTVIKNHAVYSRNDREAAHHYRSKVKTPKIDQISEIMRDAFIKSLKPRHEREEGDDQLASSGIRRRSGTQER